MSDERGPGRLRAAMLALCHALSDFYGIAFAPLAETFRAHFSLTEQGVAVIAAVIGVFGSMMQPLFGLWCDRTRRGVMAAVGLAVSAVFVAQMGWSVSALHLGVLLTLGALGVSAFHPSAAVLATKGARRRSVATAYFLSGGGVGLALAPLVVAAVVKAWGLGSLWVICLPGLALAVWIFVATRDEKPVPPTGKTFNLRAMFGPGTGAVWLLLAVATLRALVITAFIVFLSLLGATREWDVVASGRAQSLALACAVVGSLWGGHLAQRWEPRAVLAASCVLAAPLFFVFAADASWIGLAALGAAGFAMGVGNPVNVSFAQDLRPQSASMVSGLMMGMGWGLANVLLIPVGFVAKAMGIGLALQVTAWLTVPAGILALLLPTRLQAREAVERGSVEREAREGEAPAEPPSA